MRRVFLASLCLLTACVGIEPEAPAVGALSQAVGEPMNGFPTPEERLGVMAINRARSDPTTVKGPNSTIYPPRPPILWHYDLSRASRLHAVNMQTARSTLMHDSPCPLVANVAQNGCDGNIACACVNGAVGQACRNCAKVMPTNNGCGTATFTRIGYFTNIGSGEVAAAGYQDTWSAVLGWVNEPTGADGHRTNLLDVSTKSNTMGFGHAGGGGCYSTFDVSDSGNQVGLVIPPIASAAVNPARPAAGNARFWASWADAGGAPRGFWVVVDGQCTALKQELGNPTLNSTWYADVNLAAGCHTWYVLGNTAGGARNTFPTSGALHTGSGCMSDYVAQQPPAPCDGNPPPMDLSMGGAKVDLSGGARVDLAGGGMVRDFAVPGGEGGVVAPGGIGITCHSHPDCSSNVCLFVTPVSGYCSANCMPADPASCPLGYTCGPVDGRDVCIKDGGNGGGGGGGGASGCSLAPPSPSSRGGATGAAVLFTLLLLATLAPRRYRARPPSVRD